MLKLGCTRLAQLRMVPRSTLLPGVLSAAFLAIFAGTVPGAGAELIPGTLSGKPSFEVAQAPALLAPPNPDDSNEKSQSENGSSKTDPAYENGDSTEQTGSSPSAGYVFAGDLARQLRKIDPSAKVEWNGKSLRVEASGQKFSMFPTGDEIVINGNVEKTAAPLRIRNGEIYVPKGALTRIGKELEKTGPTEATSGTEVQASPTPAATPAPSPSPTAAATPESTPTPEPAANSGILPDITETPETTPEPTHMIGHETKPTPHPTPTAAVSTPESKVTPFPVATPTPTPRPTPTPVPTPTPTPKPTPTPRPRRTPHPAKTRITSAREHTPAPPPNDPFQQLLQERNNIAQYKLPSFSTSQLEALATANQVKKVALLADDAGLNDGSENNSQSAAICMQMAERIKAELVKRHIDVDMIRSSDSYVPLGKKLQEIESSKAQLLLVISVGSSADFVDLGGYRILYMNSSVDYNSLHSKALDASEQVAPEMIYQSFEKNSKVLASAIKNSLTRLLDREPVGMNPGPLYLARRAPMAAATVVIGYLTNPADARRLTDSSQQNSMAQAIAQGIADYSNLLGQGQSGSAGESH